MPFDKYFQAGHRARNQRKAAIAAKHRASWPEGSHFTSKVKMEMKGGGRDWWHFLDVPNDESERELTAWRAHNPGYQFRLVR